MLVLVAAEGGAVQAAVRDQGNLRQLHAEFHGVADADAALREAGLGQVAGDHAWLEAGALRVRAHIVRT